MSSYLDQQSTRHTPQSEPIPGSEQVENSAGGFTWQVDNWTRLRRFLVLGSEGGSYYAGESKLTTENVGAVRWCIKTDGLRVVSEVLDVSVNGRAPKQDPGIFVLALCASAGLGDGMPTTKEDDKTRAAALAAVPNVCRYGTTLFMFVRFCEQHRGWGRGLRNAIGSWYTEPHFNTARRADGEEVTGSHVDALAYQAVKYRQRDGFTHRDLLRLSHPKTDDARLSALLAWMADNTKDVTKLDVKNPLMPKGWRRSPFPSSVIAYEAAQAATTSEDICKLLDVFGNKLPREAIPDNLKDEKVWLQLLLAGMPMGALVRNLSTMTRLGVLTPTSAATNLVIAQLRDEERIRKARIHPLSVLIAMRTYEQGHSEKGTSTWVPISQVVDALDEAFYFSFDNVQPTGKRHLIGLDVSASMNGRTSGWDNCTGAASLSPREAAAAMAMVCMRTKDPYEVVAFTSGGLRWSAQTVGYPTGITPVPLGPGQRLTDVISTVSRLPAGGTDAALPIAYALNMEREVDVFALYTDSESWAGPVHPVQALRDYRRTTGIPAKLITVSMVSNRFTVGGSDDAGMLNVVGFDTATPSIMEAFVKD